jgi:hypothetical protein
MTNIINLNDRRPKPKDPWRHNQPSLVSKPGDRDELWSHPYFGISLMIWATGSDEVPEPPTTGGTPKAANVATYRKLRAIAA